MEERVTSRKTVTATDRPTSSEKSVSSISVAEIEEGQLMIYLSNLLNISLIIIYLNFSYISINIQCCMCQLLKGKFL